MILTQERIKDIIDETMKEIAEERNTVILSSRKRNSNTHLIEKIDKQLYNLKKYRKNIINEIAKAKITLENVKNQNCTINDNIIKYQSSLILEHEKKLEEISESIIIKEIRKKIIKRMDKLKSTLKRVPREIDLDSSSIEDIKRAYSTYDIMLQELSLINTYDKEEDQRKRIIQKSKELLDEYVKLNCKLPTQNEYFELIKESRTVIRNLFGYTYKEFLLNDLNYDESLIENTKSKVRIQRSNKSKQELLDEIKYKFQEFKIRENRYPYISELNKLGLYSTTYYCNEFEESFTKIIRDLVGLSDYKFIR